MLMSRMELFRGWLVGAVLMTLLCAGFTSQTIAQTPTRSVRVLVDGDSVQFDQPPVITNEMVLVPLRGVFERLGATAVWASGSQMVRAQRGATSVALRIGSTQASVNRQPQVLDGPAVLVGDRTMVPLRFVSQALGADVRWDAATSTVRIASPAAGRMPSSPAFTPRPPQPIDAASPGRNLDWRPAVPVHVTFAEHLASGRAPEVDLRPIIMRRGLAVRDQGNRGTCTVFATTFLIEYQRAAMTSAHGSAAALSEEYLNWAGNKATGEDSDGGRFTKMITGYEAWGIAPNASMPYQSTYDPKRPATPSASTIVTAKAMFPVRYPFTTLKVWDNTKGMTPAELQRVLATLRSGRPVATGIWWLTNFATVTVDGVPLLKDYPRSANSGSNPPMFDGHSIDLVGFHQARSFPGGGYFIFRNSFGPTFGNAGYGFVSFRYLRTYANDAIVISAAPWHQ
jgi:hypothetical protein